MTNQRTPEALTTFAKLEYGTAELSALRRGDLKFLHGQQLTDSRYHVVIKSAEATSLSIDKDNFPLDGTISLRVGVRLEFKNSGSDTFDPEEAVLWLTADDSTVAMELEIDGGESLDFELNDFNKLLSRLG